MNLSFCSEETKYSKINKQTLKFLQFPNSKSVFPLWPTQKAAPAANQSGRAGWNTLLKVPGIRAVDENEELIKWKLLIV